MTANDTTPQTVEWGTVAAGWDRNRAMVETMKAGLTERLLAFLTLQPAERVLELGAGTGELAALLADAVGDGGDVLASDVAPGMVDLIAATNAGRPNVRAALLDAGDLGPRDEEFDAVVFRMGLMFLTQPERAMAEIRRVLKPGGRLALTTWAGPQENMWLVAIGMSAMLNGMISGPMPTEAGGPLSLSDPDRLVELARSAGFATATVDAVDVAFTVAGVDEHIAHVTALAPPLAAAYEVASRDQRETFRASVEDMTKQFRTADGMVIPGRALLLQAS